MPLPTAALPTLAHTYTLRLEDPEGAFDGLARGATLTGDVTVEVSLES